MPIGNILSVLEHGILSYERAAALSHDSVALQKVQDIRDAKQIPGGLKLHQYANLYFHARNPMLFKRKEQGGNICVLQVSIEVLGLPGVVLADSNASSKYVRFLAPGQWRVLDFSDIFAMDWRHPEDQIAQWRHTARKCAEVLVPHQVAPQFLLGARVVDNTAARRLEDAGFTLPIVTDPQLFFQ